MQGSRIRFLGIVALWFLPSYDGHFLDLPELHFPAFTDSTISNQSFTHFDAEGRITQIDYHVEHAEAFDNLDALPGLSRVTCPDADQLTLYFEDTAAAATAAERLVDGLLVVGSSDWECGTAHENTRHFHKAIHRRITGRCLISGSRLTLPTRVAGYTDFFKNADVTFTTAKFPAGPRASHAHSAAGAKYTLSVSDRSCLHRSDESSRSGEICATGVPQPTAKGWRRPQIGRKELNKSTRVPSSFALSRRTLHVLRGRVVCREDAGGRR